MKKFYTYQALIFYALLISLAFPSAASAQTIVCFQVEVLDDICMELLETEAPVTTQNFISYVQRGTYRSSFFHDAVDEGSTQYLATGKFVITGFAGLTGIMEVTTSPPIINESSVSNTRGTVAMVPEDPNDPDSATSQFLINVTDNPELDTLNGGYTVFARIIGNGLNSLDQVMLFDRVALEDEGLLSVPVLIAQLPAENSLAMMFTEVFIFDGDINDFENGGSGGGGDGGDSGGDGGDGGGDTPTPGDDEVLIEDAVCMDTNVGEFCMQLLPGVAPITVENFLNYVNSGRYDDTIVHRSVPNFVIQGGGYLANPLGASITRDPAIQNEFNRSNLRGTVAMARQGGVVNSATSEWFVNLVNNTQLDSVDGGFTVFAQIISGLDIVDGIADLPISNQQNSLGGAFGELPLADQDSDGVDADDVVLVQRAYVTDVIINDSGSDGGDGSGDGGNDGPAVETTAQYSTLTNSFRLPVWIGDELYRVLMFRDATAPGVTFRVDTSAIVSLNDVGQETATMDLDSGVLSIPSIQVGNLVATDVIFTLTDFSTLTFKLESYNTL